MGRPPSDEHVASRFRELVEQLGGHWGFGYGWQSRAAELLGLHPSDVSKIRKGQRRINWAAAHQSAQRMGLDPSFFTAPSGDHFTTFTELDAHREPRVRHAPEEAKETQKGLRLVDLVKLATEVLRPLLAADRNSVALGRLDEELATHLAHEILNQHLVQVANAYLGARSEDRQLTANVLAWTVLHEQRSLVEAVERRAARAEAEVVDLTEEVENLRALVTKERSRGKQEG